MENKELYLGLKVDFTDGSQPFELIKDNAGTGWFAPSRWLETLPGVIKVELANTTSSSGDWDGYFAVQSGNRIYLVLFFRENNEIGYTLHTETDVFSIVDSVDEIEDAANSFYESLNELYFEDYSDGDCPLCGAEGEGWTSSCAYCHRPDPRIDDVEND